jgi:hypothetical protein
MRVSIAAFVMASVLVLAGARPAEAQVAGGVVGPRVFTGPGGPVTLTPGYGYSGAFAYRETPRVYSSGYVPPYSYYVLPASMPSRIYVGPDVFPFYGRPYGHPNDRWSWSYMGNANGDVLARYYYPPLGW